MLLNDYLDSLYANGSIIVSKSLAAWKRGITYEVDFWSKWFETRGLEWPDDFTSRLSPRPLDVSIEALTAAFPENSAVAVLDVGAGPATKGGTYSPRPNVKVFAIDPLADYYDRIIAASGMTVPLKTQRGFAEDLSARFGESAFQVITCTNALDHAIEPIWGIIEMILTLSIGGTIILGHRRNEAMFEQYTGFHQWNMDYDDGKFVIWNPEARYVVNDILKGVAEVDLTVHGSSESPEHHYIVTRITKRAPLPIEREKHHRCLRAALLDALVAKGTAA